MNKDKRTNGTVSVRVVLDAVGDLQPDSFKYPKERMVLLRINYQMILLGGNTRTGDTNEFIFPPNYYLEDSIIRAVRINFQEKHLTLIMDHYRKRGMLKRPKQYAAQPPALYYKYLLANDFPFIISKRE